MRVLSEFGELPQCHNWLSVPTVVIVSSNGLHLSFPTVYDPSTSLNVALVSIYGQLIQHSYRLPSVEGVNVICLNTSGCSLACIVSES